jgi:VWFA-related protein
MHLDVVVAAKSGPLVSDLQQRDFTVLDNKIPQTITSFHAVTGRDARTEVVLVIDAVNDSAVNVGYERLQIDKFLHSDEGKLAYPVAIAIFTDKGITSLTTFSSDGNSLSAALQKEESGLRDISRSGAYWGAAERLQLSLAVLSQLAATEAPRPGRRLIVWVSPGWPLFDRPNLQTDARLQEQLFENIVGLSTDLLRARATLYSVDTLGAAEPIMHAFEYKNFLKGVSKPGQAQVGDLALQVLSVQSGGLALGGVNDIAALLEQCMADVAPYYEISFQPASPKRSDEYHALEIQVSKPGLTARSRQGYYALPSPRK